MDSESVVSQVQRKIELQSPEDLSYLVANVRNVAEQRLNEAFPHVAAGEDELRDQIEALVNEYVDNIFTLAAPNLSINGLPVNADSFLSSTASSAAAPVAYEPFDARKRRRVADLVAQEEKLREDVASLKRSVPAAAAAQQAERLDEGLRRDEEDVKSREESAQRRWLDTTKERGAEDGGDDDASGKDREDGVSAPLLLSSVKPLERQDGVEERFRRAVQGLGGLKSDMPAVVAKMERARVAGEYVVTEGRH